MTNDKNDKMQVVFCKEDIKKIIIDNLVTIKNQEERNEVKEKANAYVDIVIVEFPNNVKKENGEETPKAEEAYEPIHKKVYVWLSGTPIEDTIRELAEQSYEKVRRNELCDSIKESLRACGNSVVFSSEKLIKNGNHPGMAKEYFLLIMVGLKETIAGYADLVQYITEDIKKKLKSTGDFLKMGTRGRKDNLFVNVRKKWVLLGNFAEYYMKEKGLPEPEIMTKLSAAPYEGSESEARIYFTDYALHTVEMIHSLGKEDRVINIKNLRMIRKLMELSKRDTLYLYADMENKDKYIITRLVQRTQKDEEERKDIYVKFSGFMHWGLFEGEREIFSYYHGEYGFNTTEENQAYLEKIESLENVDRQMVKDLVKVLCKQKHGTSVVLFDKEKDAASEADRLCEMRRGIKIQSNNFYDKETGWDEEFLLSITGIDGALFIGPDGTCLAIGVIVDGKIIIRGNVGRGARYNSIVNYIGLHPNCVGIIISEDGMVDVIKNPQ